MRVTQISVALEKRVNDSDYGSEKAEVQVTAALEAIDDPQDCLQLLLIQVRDQVEQDLRHSVNREVRRRMNPKPRLCSECQHTLGDDENYLHAGCEELVQERRRQQRVEQEARWEAERVAARRDDETAGDEVEEIEGEDANELEDIPL